MRLEAFTPNYMVERIYNLDVAQLKAHQIELVLADLDNTLLAWNNPNGTPELRQWLRDLEAGGIRVVVVSNNTTKRVSRAVAGLGIDFISWSLKPLPRGILRALRKYQVAPENALMVGDQLLTDVWAAHHAGVRSVLVKRLIDSDMWQTWVNRFVEKHIKKIVFKAHPALKWEKTLRDN